MNLWQAVLLGIVEGITEFLPVSSTGHLTIAEELLGLPVADPGVTAFTALIQVGAIAAVLVYFRTDIRMLAWAWGRGLVLPAERQRPEYRMAWYIIAGSIPIGVAGFLAKDLIAGPLRSLWVVAVALVAWSLVMYLAERASSRREHSNSVLTLRDSLVIGTVQCVALVPGVSRSGATISAGLFRGLDRVTATRVSFFLSIPALVAAGAYEGLTTASDLRHRRMVAHGGRDGGQLRRRIRVHCVAAPAGGGAPDHRIYRLPDRAGATAHGRSHNGSGERHVTHPRVHWAARAWAALILSLADDLSCSSRRLCEDVAAVMVGSVILGVRVRLLTLAGCVPPGPRQ